MVYESQRGALNLLSTGTIFSTRVRSILPFIFSFIIELIKQLICFIIELYNRTFPLLMLARGELNGRTRA